MKNKIIPATTIVFNDKEEILLTQRNYKDDPANRYHGAWGFPGGAIEENEQPLEAAVRETREETEIEIDAISDRPIVASCIEATGNHVIKLAYISKYRNGKINTDKDSGTSDAKWFSLEEINKLNTTPLTKEMSKKAIGLLNGELKNKKLIC